jgi:rsbT co-antagonist protein RsbR
MFSQLRTHVLFSGVVILALVIGLVALTVLERQDLNVHTTLLQQVETARGQARELSLYVQYNAHDSNAYTLGHLEHRQEFVEHAASFTAILDELQRAIDADVLDHDEQELLDVIKQTRAEYDQESFQLFAAADANRDTPSPANQAQEDAAWEAADQLGDQLDEQSQMLAEHIHADVEQVERLIVARNDLMVKLLLGLGLAVVVLVLFILGLVGRTLGAPLTTLLSALQRFTAGDFATRVLVTRRDEIGAIGTAFNTLAQTVEQHTDTLVRLEVAETARAEAEAARAQISAHLATIEEQRSVLRDLSTPILPVTSSVLVMPLVGAIDSERLALVQQQALGTIERTSARYLIIDVTGVPLLDADVARGLNQVVVATGLLGAKAILVGIRPEVAQTLVGLGIQLERVITHSTLQSALQDVREQDKMLALN